eukprot:1061690-Karenia_brevis.AAC.1
MGCIYEFVSGLAPPCLQHPHLPGRILLSAPLLAPLTLCNLSHNMSCTSPRHGHAPPHNQVL